MYNLFVSGSTDDWKGDPWIIELGRCVREHTDDAITRRFGELDAAAVGALKRLPAIFAYETVNNTAPKFGVIRDIVRRQDKVRIAYEIQRVDPFLTPDSFLKLSFELGINKLEMNRTHWAVKDIDLAKELRGHHILLPTWAQNEAKAVNIDTHQFDIALSFPGEIRSFVESIVHELEHQIPREALFYDNNFIPHLARPSLDVLLQDIYRRRAKLVVVFLCGDYQKKEWCGVEFRAIREIMLQREHSRIMFVRVDDASVDGVFKTDGFIDARKFSPSEIAQFICERAAHLP